MRVIYLVKNNGKGTKQRFTIITWDMNIPAVCMKPNGSCNSMVFHFLPHCACTPAPVQGRTKGTYHRVRKWFSKGSSKISNWKIGNENKAEHGFLNRMKNSCIHIVILVFKRRKCRLVLHSQLEASKKQVANQSKDMVAKWKCWHVVL